jgi:hypothetical protein
MQAPVVVAAVAPRQRHELVEPGPRLVAVAHAELHHVELGGQRAPGVQVVPGLERLQDQVADGLAVAGVALAARQGLLVVAARRLFPQRQRLPVQRVEPPDAALPARHPGLQRHAGGFLGSLVLVEQALDQGAQVGTRAAAQIDRELEAGLGRARPRFQIGILAGGAFEDGPVVGDLAEAGPVLDPVAHHAEAGQVEGSRAERVDDRPEGRGHVDRVLAAEPAHRPDVNAHVYALYPGG